MSLRSTSGTALVIGDGIVGRYIARRLVDHAYIVDQVIPRISNQQQISSVENNSNSEIAYASSNNTYAITGGRSRYWGGQLSLPLQKQKYYKDVEALVKQVSIISGKNSKYIMPRLMTPRLNDMNHVLLVNPKKFYSRLIANYSPIKRRVVELSGKIDVDLEKIKSLITDKHYTHVFWCLGGLANYQVAKSRGIDLNLVDHIYLISRLPSTTVDDDKELGPAYTRAGHAIFRNERLYTSSREVVSRRKIFSHPQYPPLKRLKGTLIDRCARYDLLKLPVLSSVKLKCFNMLTITKEFMVQEVNGHTTIRTSIDRECLDSLWNRLFDESCGYVICPARHLSISCSGVISLALEGNDGCCDQYLCGGWTPTETSYANPVASTLYDFEEWLRLYG